MKKLDRRVRRTRKLLAESLLSLITQKDYDAITIQDITDHADLNRATFYLHYGTKEELLIAALESRFDEVVERVEAQGGFMDDWTNSDDIVLIYEHVREYAPLYKVLLGGKGQAHVVNRIVDYIAEVDERSLRETLGADIQPTIPLELVARHMAGSLYALLSWWVLNDMPHSAEYMAKVTHQLCLSGCLTLVPGGIFQQPA